MEVENDLNYFSKYLTLFYTRHKNYILVLIYYVFCGKSPPFLSIQLFYPSSIQHRKKILKKLVIKAVSVNILLFDLNIYKVYLAEIRYTGNHCRKGGKPFVDLVSTFFCTLV